LIFHLHLGGKREKREDRDRCTVPPAPGGEGGR